MVGQNLFQPPTLSPLHSPSPCQPRLDLLDVEVEVIDLILQISDHFVSLGQRHMDEIIEELVSNNDMLNSIDRQVKWVVRHDSLVGAKVSGNQLRYAVVFIL